MPVKHYLKVLSGVLVSSLVLAQAEDREGDLGYRTHGYELGHGNTHSGPAVDYGHTHLTKPRYGNPAYYRSYHAHKDVIKEYGGDLYAPPWHLNPFYFDSYAYPLRNNSYLLSPHANSEQQRKHLQVSDGAIVRRLEQTLDGKCFELKRSEDTELRIELPAAECEEKSRTE